MKLMIASDIHGSAVYCGDMLKALDREQADKLLLLGDILYHGPRNDLPDGYAPKEVLSCLNARRDKILSVRGNCDTEVDQMVLDFPVMADYGFLHLDGRTLYATHGHIFNENHLPPLAEGDILLMGHTHVPCAAETNGHMVLNPGSVSIPKEGSWRGYMIYEDGLFLWKDLAGQERMTRKAE